MFLTAPFKHSRGVYGLGLSEMEDGGHVRLGYTHKELERMLLQNNFDIIRQDYVSGILSQALTSFMFMLHRVLSRWVVWLVLFPLRAFLFFDGPVTRLTGFQYLSVAVIAEKSKEG